MRCRPPIDLQDIHSDGSNEGHASTGPSVHRLQMLQQIDCMPRKTNRVIHRKAKHHRTRAPTWQHQPTLQHIDAGQTWLDYKYPSLRWTWTKQRSMQGHESEEKTLLQKWQKGRATLLEFGAVLWARMYVDHETISVPGQALIIRSYSMVVTTCPKSAITIWFLSPQSMLRSARSKCRYPFEDK